MKKRALAVLSSAAVLATLLAPLSAGTAAASPAPVAAYATPTVPVILVPGVGGSQIWGIPNGYNNDSGNGSDVVWVDKVADHFSFDLLVNDAELKYNLELKHVTGGHVTDVVPKNSDVRVWPLKDEFGLKGISYLDADQWDISLYFNHMIEVFQQNGYVPGKTLWGLPYDWRQDYAKEFDNITNTINQALAASGQQKVAIVAHSQGGLLIKSYLLAHPEMESKIDRFITLGTPFLGAAMAARATSSKLGGYNFSLSVVDNATGFEISKTAPAVYHLAPSYEYESAMFSRYGRGTINSYNSPYYIPTNPSQGYYTQLRNFEYDKGLFDWSSGRHGVWDKTAPNVKRYHIVADSVSTEVAYDYDYNWFWGSSVDYIMKAGDGTVPLISAQRPGNAAGTIFYAHTGASGSAVDHVGLVKDDNVITKVLHLLNGNESTPVAGIDLTPNTSLDGMSFAAYSMTGEPEMFDLDVVVTNRDTGAQETYTFKKGKYVRQGKSTGVAVRTAVLDGKLDVQYIAPAETNIDIEVNSHKDAEFQFRSYESGAKGVKNKVHHGLLKHQAKEKLNIKQEKGKREVTKGGKQLKTVE
jgi:pimeloyl-ACP methyl ester carboxylesterase